MAGETQYRSQAQGIGNSQSPCPVAYDQRRRTQPDRQRAPVSHATDVGHTVVARHAVFPDGRSTRKRGGPNKRGSGSPKVTCLITSTSKVDSCVVSRPTKPVASWRHSFRPSPIHSSTRSRATWASLATSRRVISVTCSWWAWLRMGRKVIGCVIQGN